MDAEVEYRHEALKSRRSIRILHLLPISKGEMLRGKIKILETLPKGPLDEDRAYDALSYHRGPVDPACFITLEKGRRLSISKNCSDALLRLRRSKRSRRLWVDAICLDQSESEAALEERNRHISRMEQILNSAKTVLVWLGVSDLDTGRLFAELSRYGASTMRMQKPHIIPAVRHDSKGIRLKTHHPHNLPVNGKQRHTRISLKAQEPNQTESSPCYKNEDTVDRLDLSVLLAVHYLDDVPTSAPSESFDGVIIPSLISLLQRSYFTRFWTLQEVALARQCTVVCGDYALPLSLFASGVLFVESWINAQRTSEDISWLQPFKSYWNMWLQCQRLRNLRRSSASRIGSRLREAKQSSINQAELLPLLQILRKQRATQNVDKVFAAYNLMELYMDYLEIRFHPPDYRQTAFQCYVNATLTWMVYRERPLELLKLVPSSWHHQRLSGLPSWVPDWSDADAPQAAPTKKQFNASHSASERYALVHHGHGFAMQVLSGSDLPDMLPPKRGLLNHLRLYVRAKFIGKVSRRSYCVMHEDYLPPRSADNAIVRELDDSHRARCLLDWFRFMNPKHDDIYEPTEEQMLTALYSVLFGFSDVDTDQDSYSPKTLVDLFDSDLLDKAPIEAAKANYHARLTNASNRGVMSFAEATCPRPAPPTYLHIYLTNAGKANAIHFIRGVTQNTVENSLFETDSLYLGSANERLACGDAVALLEGADMPFVLRQRGRRHEYTVIGPAYIHGLMHGEKWRSAGRLKQISLV